MILDKVGTYDNTSDIGTKPVDLKTLERHLVALRLGGGSEEDETSLMQVSGERRHFAGGDLARLARVAKQCGGCLVGLAAQPPRADAHRTEDEKESCTDLFMMVAMLLMTLWTILVVIATRRLVMQKPQLQMTSGIQTDTVWKPDTSDMTTQSVRSEFSHRRLPTKGTKDELVNRLTLAVQRGS